MTKAIIHMIHNNEPFQFRVNNFTTLVFYDDTIFRDRQWLVVKFDSINNVQYNMGHRFIKSRDLNGIRLEVEQAIRDYLSYVTTIEVNNLKNGRFI